MLSLCGLLTRKVTAKRMPMNIAYRRMAAIRKRVGTSERGLVASGVVPCGACVVILMLMGSGPRFPHRELKGRHLGADDYVIKPIDFEVLTTIINARLAGVARSELWPKLVQLNDREVETLTWVARGKTSAEIAQILGLTKRTVDFHIDNARTKLGAATRTQAVIKAATGRLIDP